MAKKGGGTSGCLVFLIIIGLILYYPMKCYKEWKMNPLEYQVNVRAAHFRKSPSLKGKIIKTAKKGTTFFMLNDSSYNSVDRRWVHGTIGNDTGWIYRELIEQDIWK